MLLRDSVIHLVGNLRRMLGPLLKDAGMSERAVRAVRKECQCQIHVPDVVLPGIWGLSFVEGDITYPEIRAVLRDMAGREGDGFPVVFVERYDTRVLAFAIAGRGNCYARMYTDELADLLRRMRWPNWGEKWRYFGLPCSAEHVIRIECQRSQGRPKSLPILSGACTSTRCGARTTGGCAPA